MRWLFFCMCVRWKESRKSWRVWSQKVNWISQSKFDKHVVLCEMEIKNQATWQRSFVRHLLLMLWLCLVAAPPAGGITADKLFHMMKDQTISMIVMDARSHRDYEESRIQVPAQTCISVPEEAIIPGWDTRLHTWIFDIWLCICNSWYGFRNADMKDLSLTFLLIKCFCVHELCHSKKKVYSV